MTNLQQNIREIILKYTNDYALKPQYDGMTAWELAGIILKECEKVGVGRKEGIMICGCPVEPHDCDNCSLCGTDSRELREIFA